MTKRHPAALAVGVDLMLHPTPPMGIRQGDALSLAQADPAIGAELLDVKNPVVAIGHSPFA